MSLRFVREMSFHLLYQFEFQKEKFEEQVEDFLALARDNEHAMQELYDLNWSESEQSLSARLAVEVYEKRDELDKFYVSYLKGWKISRLPKVDKIILRLAVYELLYRADVPVNVVLNEAVELIKSYSSEKSKAYVNAVLGHVLKANLEPIAALRGIEPEVIKESPGYRYAENDETNS